MNHYIASIPYLYTYILYMGYCEIVDMTIKKYTMKVVVLYLSAPG